MQREFLTPEPVTIEIRNAAGDVDVELVDDTRPGEPGGAGHVTVVEVQDGHHQPLGFLDDVLKAVNNGRIGDELRNAFGRRGDGDAAGGGPAAWFAGLGGGQDDTRTDTDTDPVSRVRIEHTEPRADGRRAVIVVDTDPARSGWRSSFTIRVRAPRGSGVRAQTQSADVTVVGVADRLDIRTASGTVTVDRVSEKAVVQTASGSVTLTETADADLRTASGRVGIHQIDGQLVAHSTSGDVRVDRSSGDGTVRTVSGDIHLGEVGAGHLEAVTVSGSVEVALRPGLAAGVELSTISGSTDSDLPITEHPDPDAGDGPGTPDLDLRVSTTSGTVRLRRAVAV